MKIDVILENLDAWIEAYKKFTEWAGENNMSDRGFENFMYYLLMLKRLNNK